MICPAQLLEKKTQQSDLDKWSAPVLSTWYTVSWDSDDRFGGKRVISSKKQYTTKSKTIYQSGTYTLFTKDIIQICSF
jgi:hypothetical protein